MQQLTLIALLLAVTATNMTGQILGPGKGDETPLARGGSFEDFMECVQKHGGTLDDFHKFQVAAIMMQDIDKDKCVAGCFFQFVDLIKGDKFDKNAYIKRETMYVGKKNATEAGEMCDKELKGKKDPCEIGNKIVECRTKVQTQS